MEYEKNLCPFAMQCASSNYGSEERCQDLESCDEYFRLNAYEIQTEESQHLLWRRKDL